MGSGHPENQITVFTVAYSRWHTVGLLGIGQDLSEQLQSKLGRLSTFCFLREAQNMQIVPLMLIFHVLSTGLEGVYLDFKDMEVRR